LYTNFCYNANCGSNWLTSPTIIGNLEAGVIYAWNTQASSDCSVPCTNSAYTDDQFFEIQPLITASGNTTVCAPNCVQLSLHQPSSLGTCPVCNGFTQTYQWFLNGNPITGATGATYCANTTGTNLYTAEITWTGDYISGCGSSLTTYPSNVISVTINTAPTSVSATATPNPVCEGQTLYLYGYGGTGATSWSWTGPSFSGGGQNQSLTATLSNAGTYTCTATNACGSASVPTSYVTVNPLPSITGYTITPNPICVGQTLSLSGTGNNVTSWSWFAPGGWASTGQSTSLVNIQPYNSGTFTILANNSCGTFTLNPTVTVDNPSVTASVNQNVSCGGGNDGSATAFASGGAGPYTYSWSGGGNNATKTGLTAGTYTINVTDMTGCTCSYTVTITAPPVLTVNATVNTEVNCSGGSDGSATSSVSGGLSPYSYLWSNSATTSSISSLTAGAYTLNVTDNNSCTGTSSVTITAPPFLNVNATVNTSVSCNGGSNGSATSIISGGTSPYTYLWSNSTTTSSISSLTAGTYTLSVTDNNSCTGSYSVTITQPLSALSVSANSTGNDSCNGSNNGSASSTASGGTTPYTYSWTNGSTTSFANNLTAGIYNVTVTDNHSCAATASITITQPTQLTSTLVAHPNPICIGDTSIINVIASGGTFGYTYSWNIAGTNSSIHVSPATTTVYTSTVTDANGCIIKDTVSVFVNCTTGMEEITSDNGQITIYPNPNNGIFTIKSSGLADHYSIEIYNVLGQKVTVATLNQVQGDNLIDLRSNPSGIYFYRIIKEDGSLLGEGKVVIEK
jgi:hypothetical protein